MSFAPPPTGDDSVAASSNGAGGSFGQPATGTPARKGPTMNRPQGGSFTATANKPAGFSPAGRPMQLGPGPVIPQIPNQRPGATMPGQQARKIQPLNADADGTQHGTNPPNSPEVQKYKHLFDQYRKVHESQLPDEQQQPQLHQLVVQLEQASAQLMRQEPQNPHWKKAHEMWEQTAKGVFPGHPGVPDHMHKTRMPQHIRGGVVAGRGGRGGATSMAGRGGMAPTRGRGGIKPGRGSMTTARGGMNSQMGGRDGHTNGAQTGDDDMNGASFPGGNEYGAGGQGMQGEGPSYGQSGEQDYGQEGEQGGQYGGREEAPGQGYGEGEGEGEGQGEESGGVEGGYQGQAVGGYDGGAQY